MSRRPRIAIACQGGASQTAFTAGALAALLRAGVQDRFEIVALSGASGGAVCALLAWDALRRGDPDPAARLEAFWRENAASTPFERGFNALAVGMVRAVASGLLPALQSSPGTFGRRAAAQVAAAAMRPEFTDLGALLARHVDFAALAREGPCARPPTLLIGALDVLAGESRVFSSRIEAIGPAQILASAAVPELFPAVALDGGVYWDGLYSDNPPVSAALRPALVGRDNLPDEVWVVKVSPTRAAAVPHAPEAIADRRLHLVANLSLFHQLQTLEMLNRLAAMGALEAGFFAGFGLSGAVRHPSAFGRSEASPWHIPFIEMSDAMAGSLDHASKIDRDPALIAALMADGAAQATAFLAAR
jgi:NTE family protein